MPRASGSGGKFFAEDDPGWRPNMGTYDLTHPKQAARARRQALLNLARQHRQMGQALDLYHAAQRHGELSGGSLPSGKRGLIGRRI